MGYSQQATSRLTSISQQTIWSWVNELAFSAQFRDEIARRAQMFRENLDNIEEQQVMTATSIIGRALQGDLPRDSRGNLPAEFVAAVELLRPRWKTRHGEGHRKFGAS